MHLVGREHIMNLLRTDCLARDTVKALIAELAHRTWRHPAAMARDYPSASFAGLPKVAFCLSPCPATLECLVDFGAGVVLLDACRRDACPGASLCARRKTP